RKAACSVRTSLVQQIRARRSRTSSNPDSLSC
ncbi:phage DNA-binding protein KilA, partial [Escherichia coli]